MNNIITTLKDKIKNLENEINNKNKEIDDYKFKVQNLSEVRNNITSIKPGEKIFTVLFMTQGSQDIINYGKSCKNTDLFIRLEERLYTDFPQYRKYDTYFQVNTRNILRFQTLDENHIKNNDIINVFVNEI